MTIITSLLLVFCALAKLADVLALNSSKTKYYEKSSALYVKLDDINISNFHQSVAALTLKVFNLTFGVKIIALRSLAVGFALSVILTTFALTNFFQDQIRVDPLNTPLHTAILYAINLVFDLLSFFITWKVLLFVRRASITVAVFLIVLDVYIGIVLAGFGYVVATAFGPYAYANHQVTVLPLPISWPFNAFAVVHFAYEALTGREFGCIENGLFYNINRRSWDSGVAVVGATQTDAYFMLTMLFPTAMYMAILMSVIVCKAILSGLRSTVLHVTLKIADDEPQKNQMFNLLSLFFGALSAACALVIAVGPMLIDSSNFLFNTGARSICSEVLQKLRLSR